MQEKKKCFGQGVFIYANPASQTLESIYNFDFNLGIQILVYYIFLAKFLTKVDKN